MNIRHPPSFSIKYIFYDKIDLFYFRDVVLMYTNANLLCQENLLFSRICSITKIFCCKKLQNQGQLKKKRIRIEIS